nr:hypothetical protein [Tanacetum cinerariifolium]
MEKGSSGDGGLKLQVGQLAEMKTFEDGFRGAWFRCKVVWVVDQRNEGCIIVEPPPHVFKKKSLIVMSVIMELQNRMCVWPVTRAMKGEEEAKEEAEGEGANEGAGGSAEMYQNMSQGDWQVRQARWMDQQDERWEQFDA